EVPALGTSTHRPDWTPRICPSVPGGGSVGVTVGVGPGPEPSSRPKKLIAWAAIPGCGRLCPAPLMVYASTWPDPYTRRVQPDCGLVVEVGVWEMPCTFVNWSISFCSMLKFSTSSAVPCQAISRGRGPV